MPALTSTIMLFDNDENYHISMVELQNFIEYYYFSDLTNERINSVLMPSFRIPDMAPGSIRNTDGISHLSKEATMNTSGGGNPHDEYWEMIADLVVDNIEEAVAEIEADNAEEEGEGNNGE